MRYAAARSLLRAGFDTWLNRAVNFAMLAACGFVVYSLVNPAPRRVQPPLAAPEYKAGDLIKSARLPLEGRGLVLVTRSTCPACTSALPFYRTLEGVRITALADESVDINREYLASNGVNVSTLRALDDSGLQISALPALIAVDEAGRVLKMWRGTLTSAQEAEVLRTVKGGRP